MHLRHKTQRINPYPTLHQLKMQMETCTVTGTAYITYNLPCYVHQTTTPPLPLPLRLR